MIYLSMTSLSSIVRSNDLLWHEQRTGSCRFSAFCPMIARNHIEFVCFSELLFGIDGRSPANYRH